MSTLSLIIFCILIGYVVFGLIAFNNFLFFIRRPLKPLQESIFGNNGIKADGFLKTDVERWKFIETEGPEGVEHNK